MGTKEVGSQYGEASNSRQCLYLGNLSRTEESAKDFLVERSRQQKIAA